MVECDLECMIVDKEQKQIIIEQFRSHEQDTGSTEVQIAILTKRIQQLTQHLRIHRHDYHCQRGLLKLVGQRRRLLRYLSKEDSARHESVIAKLGLRK